MMFEVTEEVLTQPQHLKIDSAENRSEDGKESMIVAVSGDNRNKPRVHHSAEEDGPEEREKLISTPTGGSDDVVVKPFKYVISFFV